MIVRKILSKLAGNRYGWFGDYESWDAASRASGGYDSSEIVGKVRNALLKVKNGEAAYERDSVLFYEKEFEWGLLGSLFWIAAQREGKLRLVDFGGSLGTSYFQSKPLLGALKEVSWNIVEQDTFVNEGKTHFEDNVLKFYPTMRSCFSDKPIDVVLFACVLQYLESPTDILKEAFACRPEFIVVDNMPFLENEKSRITVQKVPPAIYTASYPCWLLNRKEFLNFFEPGYELVAGYKSGLSIPVGGKDIPYEGFLFQRRHQS